MKKYVLNSGKYRIIEETCDFSNLISSIKEIYPNILFLIIPSQEELCITFLRVQEFYESPNDSFRQKYFTLEQYKDWWINSYGNGKFDYPSKWSGFNFSGKEYLKWVSQVQKKGAFTKNELIVYKCLKKIIPLKKKYIIATDFNNATNNELIDHEISHALFYLFLEYKKASLKLLSEISTSVINKQKQYLLESGGYSDSSLTDELIALFSTTDPFFIENLKKYLKTYISSFKS